MTFLEALERAQDSEYVYRITNGCIHIVPKDYLTEDHTEVKLLIVGSPECGQFLTTKKIKNYLFLTCEWHVLHFGR